MIDPREEIIYKLIDVIEAYQHAVRIESRLRNHQVFKNLDKISSDIIRIIKK